MVKDRVNLPNVMCDNASLLQLAKINPPGVSAESVMIHEKVNDLLCDDGGIRIAIQHVDFHPLSHQILGELNSIETHLEETHAVSLQNWCPSGSQCLVVSNLLLGLTKLVNQCLRWS